MLRGCSSHWVMRIAWLTGKLLPLFESEKSRHLGSGSQLVRAPIKAPDHKQLLPLQQKKKFRATSDAHLSPMPLRTQFGGSLPTMIMSLEVAHDLSIQDLLYMLNRKLVLECIWVQKTTTPHADPVASLESEVSTHQLILIPMDTAVGSHSSRLHRSTVSKIVHAMF